MAVRIEDCPNCNHRAALHRPLDPTRDAHCDGEEATSAHSCTCPLDRAAVAIAMAFAAALVKYG